MCSSYTDARAPKFMVLQDIGTYRPGRGSARASRHSSPDRWRAQDDAQHKEQDKKKELPTTWHSTTPTL